MKNQKQSYQNMCCARHLPIVTKLGLWYLCISYLAQDYFLPKYQIVAKWFFDIFHVEMAQCIVIKSHEIWTFNVNFLLQKTSESFGFFFH